MLTIRAMTGGEGYAQRHLQQSDYYDQNRTIEGQWYGRGAELLGLEGEVTSDDFEAVRQGLDPRTGEFLRQRHSADRIASDGAEQSKARSLYDMTFSAPKSVSVMAIVGDDESLIAAHKTAVRETLEEAEKYSATRVRLAGLNDNRTTGNFIVAAYTHDTSRELDPQLHTHAVAANVTRGFIVPTVVLLAALAMMAIEAMQAGRKWPKVRGWWLRALLLNGVQVGAVWIAGVGWNGWMVRHRPWNVDAIGTFGGAIAGYVAITFFYYWWHRWRHQNDFLWRWLHQMHHSPQRIEVITSFYKHPFEILANSVLSSAILYLMVGVGPEAAAGAVLLSGLAELVYHWNVRTPYWLGFVFQRPESHCVHHEKGVRSFNYSDLPLWDMLFGTFRNPRVWNSECGFEPEQESHFGDMLLGRDVNALKAEIPSL